MNNTVLWSLLLAFCNKQAENLENAVYRPKFEDNESFEYLEKKAILK